MFYISKITPLFFILAFINLFLSLYLKAKTGNFIYYGQIAVFGFILNTIIGAFYQVIPNSQQQRLSLEWIEKIVFIIGVLYSVYIALGNFNIAYFFIASQVLIFSFHILSVVKNLKPLTVKYLTASIVFMFLSSIFLFLSLKTDNLSIQVALHTFTVGAMINAILGVQTAWIPMIYMQTLGKTKTGQIVINSLFYIHQIVVVGIILSFFIRDYKFIASFALFELIVILLFLKFVFYDSIKPQIKLHGIPYVIKFFITGHIFLVIGLILAHIVGVSGRFILIPYHIDFMVYGFGLFTIIGGMLHLTPRIIFSMKQNKKGIPLSRKKFENLYKIILISYVAFIILDIAGYLVFGVIVFSLVLLFAFLSSLIDFLKLYKT